MKIIAVTEENVEGFKQDHRDLTMAQRLARENIEDLALQIAIVNRINGGIVALGSIIEQREKQQG
jgi:hypothetical protein